MNAVELRDICVAAAEAGARVLRDLYEGPRDVRFKGRTDLVTDADKASEETVLRILRERAPGTRILAEESGAHGGNEVCFIVDPCVLIDSCSLNQIAANHFTFSLFLSAVQCLLRELESKKALSAMSALLNFFR